MPFEPQDPAYETRVRESICRQRIMETLGGRLTRVVPGEVEIELPFRDALTQQHGFLHAGVVTTLLDSACGAAALSLMPADAAVLSIEFKLNLLAPAQGELLLARGRVVRAGRTVTVCQAEGVMLREGKERQVAVMLATMMNVQGRGLQG